MENKTILVTGGAGFVGSHLCERLKNDGHRVISLDNYFTGSVENHIDGVEYREGHTKDITMLIPETPDLVFHLGEYARTEKSFEDIEVAWDLNKIGTFAVLEFCRRKKCKIIYAGSSTKFADEGMGRDQSPYAWMKATNTELVVNYAEWFGLDYAITYFYNVYGPREMAGPYGTLIRIFTEQFKKGQPLTVVAPGTQRRNFTHVYDIVDGLMLVGEKGNGDGYGIGADISYSVFEVAELFGTSHVMLPERAGNRMTSSVDNEKTKSLGWSAQNRLDEFIVRIKEEIGSVQHSDEKILIFAPTFFPLEGDAERALVDVMKTMSNLQFDVITTAYTGGKPITEFSLSNVRIHRVGNGNVLDKFLLPFLGARVARRLQSESRYLFKWSLFASYGALAALLSRSAPQKPLLITLADQKIKNIPWYVRFVMAHILGKADQIYAMSTDDAKAAVTLSKRTSLTRSIGSGDAFANQIRFVYANYLKTRTNT